jgi:hypothetical protein
MPRFFHIVVGLVLVFAQIQAKAATVQCMFMSETQISTDGVWLKSESDLMKIIKMFGDGLKIPLHNSLLSKLDSKQPFLAGSVSRGDVYLMGGEAGVTGRLIHVKNKVITIYEGMCTVGFG